MEQPVQESETRSRTDQRSARPKERQGLPEHRIHNADFRSVSSKNHVKPTGGQASTDSEDIFSLKDQKKSEPQSKEPDQKLNQSDENKKTAESQTKDNQSSKTDDSSENQSNQSEKQSETGSGSQRSETPNLSRPATPLKNQQNPQKLTKKLRKKMESEQRKREQEMAEIGAELQRKQEREKEKQREKKRKAEQKDTEEKENEGNIGFDGIITTTVTTTTTTTTTTPTMTTSTTTIVTSRTNICTGGLGKSYADAARGGDQAIGNQGHSRSQLNKGEGKENEKTISLDLMKKKNMPLLAQATEDAVTKVLEPVKDQIHQELAPKLTATDSLLKDNIGKMVRSRPTVEAIGLAAGNAVQKPEQAAYRETFQNIVIPSFERATQNMCQQVSDVFQRGTKEYTMHLESQLEAIRQKQTESRDPMLSELRKLTDFFQKLAEQIADINSQLQTQVQNVMPGVLDKILQYVREAVKEEVSSAVKEQGVKISDSVLSAMRSGAVIPANVGTPDPVLEKQHVLQSLRQGQLNAAFDQALSASNLEIVMMLCEAVDPSQVFNQIPCPLHQHVLLSLIHQLSVDLENSTILKHKYLEEAVMNLDLQDMAVQEHSKGVLSRLIQQLKLYIQAHPSDKMTKSLKMLIMASESLLK